MPDRSWPGLLGALLAGQALSGDDCRWAMGQIMDGEATPAQVAGFAVALRAKGETPEEMTGLVDAMLERAERMTVPGPVVDTCGTGGDRAHTVNISTMAAVVARGAGATVVKHGNRAASSASGSADVLEALGVVVDLPPDEVARCVAEAGIGFCFAPVFHPALRHAAVARRDLGVGTVFNFLGPLTNPSLPAAQAVGVADARMAAVMAGVLARRGISALVFRGEDGLDELTPTAVSRVWLVHDGRVTEQAFDPTDVGVARAPADALRGGDAADNADVVRAVVGGERGPVRDAVVLNAAAALLALDGVRDTPLAAQLRPAMDRAEAAIDSGAAEAALAGWVAASRAAADQPS